jgi:transcriptional regulator with XRE-family HTH domain
MQNNTSIMGDQLKTVRKAKRLKQGELADILGIHLRTYSNYERNKQTPDAGFIHNFCTTFKINYNWLFTGQGPMQMPENPAGLETKLLEKIIFKIEEHLDKLDSIISPAKKAKIISILYEEALEKEDWQEQLGLDRKTKCFIDLVSNEEGSISVNQSIDERIGTLVQEALFSDINSAVNHKIQKARESGELIDLNEKMIEMLQERVETQQIMRDREEGKYFTFVVGCCALIVIWFLVLKIPNRYSLVVSFPFVIGGIFSGIKAGKIKLGLHRIDHAINAATDLIVSLMKEKIKTEIKKQARKKANQELCS